MPWSVVKPIIEAELGKPISAVYASVEQTPLAAASIAQVHGAKLLTGEDVVIKVQKKGVQGSLRADLDLLYANARIFELLGLSTSDLSEIVSTLRSAILEEIDFTLEATRTEQFATFLKRSPELAPLVTVPKVYRQASASRVLTLERLYGVSMTDLETVRKYTESPELALIVALNTWVSSVLTNEWFHADVHAGNLLMLKDGRVAFIDFGIVGSIPRSTADAMLDFVRAFPLGDMDGVARSLSGMGFTKELDARTSAAFAMDLQAVLDSIEAMPPAELANGVVDETQLNKAVAAVGSVATNYGIKFPREFVLLIKQVLYFDRYTRILAPGLNVLEDERLSMNRGPPPQIPVEVEVLPPE
jgi:predicted unusual protein kinase regulating ubiquinone biosynthesis (AarF/ABC1/UbiB family)